MGSANEPAAASTIKTPITLAATPHLCCFAAMLEAPEGTVEQALSHMLTSGSLLLEEIEGDALIFLPHLRRAEERIAARIKSLAEAEPIYPTIDFDKAVAWCERQTGMTLAPSQREALKTVLSHRVVVITGGPGVGKTTLVNSILMILRAKGAKCLLCAPTGRAAKRLTETTGMEAKTIHRLLEIDPATGRFSRNESNALACGLLVVTGFALLLMTAGANTVLQTIVDEDKRGRVVSLYTMMVTGLAPLGGLVGGFLAEHIGARLTLRWTGLACLAAALPFAIWFRRKPGRQNTSSSPLPSGERGRG